jgi:polysaccharide deacetylase family protein (PEP-CTERM system associated)
MMAVVSHPGSHPPDATTAAADAPGGATLNALTVDVEDYFHVSAFDNVVLRSEWHRRESRVCANTERLLEMFAESGTRATFFVLGWVADRFPALVRRIHAAGHEVASHGYGHERIYCTDVPRFREDLRRAKLALEATISEPVRGYRAPSFSITRRSLWAFDVLIEEGYLYDASVYPIYHDRYGIPDWPRHIHQVRRSSGVIWEVPGSTVRFAGSNLPIGGGGYFRLLPYAWTRRGIRHVNRREGRAVVFYLHPWEIDPDQPRLAAPLMSRLRHYRNLDKTEDRLRRLLGDFRFGTVLDVLGLKSTRLPQLEGRFRSRLEVGI